MTGLESGTGSVPGGSSGAPSRPAASMAERAYALLKRRIVTNAFAPGAAIDEREVALELGMSRTPVHEAIIRLQGEELVEVAPRRGIRVLPLSPQDMREIYQILTGLETEAAGLLAQRTPAPAELAPLREALGGMHEAVAAEDLRLYTDWDERFHRGVLQLCGNRRLAAAGLRYRDQVQRAHVIALRLRPPLPARSVVAHEALLPFLLAGDEAGARASHYAQRVRAERELMDAVERHGLTVL